MKKSLYKPHAARLPGISEYVNKWTFRNRQTEENKFKIFHLLKTSGADLNAKTYLGETPLMTSIRAHYDMMFKLLLSEGAEVDYIFHPQVAPYYSHSMLQTALGSGNVQAIHILFEAGTNDSILDNLAFPSIYESNKSVWNAIQMLQEQRPRKLKILCRKVIRTVLGCNIQRDISGTGLPRTLQDYVLMTEQLRPGSVDSWDGGLTDELKKSCGCCGKKIKNFAEILICHIFASIRLTDKYSHLRLEDTYAARHMKIRPHLHVCLNNSADQARHVSP